MNTETVRNIKDLLEALENPQSILGDFHARIEAMCGSPAGIAYSEEVKTRLATASKQGVNAEACEAAARILVDLSGAYTIALSFNMSKEAWRGLNEQAIQAAQLAIERNR